MKMRAMAFSNRHKPFRTATLFRDILAHFSPCYLSPEGVNSARPRPPYLADGAFLKSPLASASRQAIQDQAARNVFKLFINNLPISLIEKKYPAPERAQISIRHWNRQPEQK
nr:hypothetical protein [uncultured Cohaesibacter sp.]